MTDAEPKARNSDGRQFETSGISRKVHPAGERRATGDAGYMVSQSSDSRLNTRLVVSSELLIAGHGILLTIIMKVVYGND